MQASSVANFVTARSVSDLETSKIACGNTTHQTPNFVHSSSRRSFHNGKAASVESSLKFWTARASPAKYPSAAPNELPSAFAHRAEWFSNQKLGPLQSYWATRSAKQKGRECPQRRRHICHGRSLLVCRLIFTLSLSAPRCYRKAFMGQASVANHAPAAAYCNVFLNSKEDLVYARARCPWELPSARSLCFLKITRLPKDLLAWSEGLSHWHGVTWSASGKSIFCS